MVCADDAAASADHAWAEGWDRDLIRVGVDVGRRFVVAQLARGQPVLNQAGGHRRIDAVLNSQHRLGVAAR
jgi:hypothetical protein